MQKQKMIAFCGLDCAECPAFHASTRLTMEERQSVADRWAKEFGAKITATEVDCVGCTAREGVHVGQCAVCEMRVCGLAKGLATCADCPEFACAKLEGFFAAVPAAKSNLMGQRAK